MTEILDTDDPVPEVTSSAYKDELELICDRLFKVGLAQVIFGVFLVFFSLHISQYLWPTFISVIAIVVGINAVCHFRDSTDSLVNNHCCCCDPSSAISAQSFLQPFLAITSLAAAGSGGHEIYRRHEKGDGGTEIAYSGVGIASSLLLFVASAFAVKVLPRFRKLTAVHEEIGNQSEGDQEEGRTRNRRNRNTGNNNNNNDSVRENQMRALNRALGNNNNNNNNDEDVIHVPTAAATGGTLMSPTNGGEEQEQQPGQEQGESEEEAALNRLLVGALLLSLTSPPPSSSSSSSRYRQGEESQQQQQPVTAMVVSQPQREGEEAHENPTQNPTQSENQNENPVLGTVVVAEESNENTVSSVPMPHSIQ